MLKSSYILILSLFFIGSLVAQNQELKNAEDAFARQDFAKTMQYLSILFGAPQQMKSDEKAKALVLRAKTYINIFHNAIKAENEALIAENQDNYILAYQDLMDAGSEKLSEEAEKELKEISKYLQGTLRLSGAGLLNNVYKDETLNQGGRGALLDEAQKYLSAAIKLRPDDYLSHDFYGQVMMLKRDKEDALKHFNLSIEHFFIIDPNISVDYGHFRVYANMAILYMQDREVDAALDILMKGKEALSKIRKKIGKQNDLTEEDYQRIFQSLVDVEMDIYLNAPEKKAEALVKFKAVVEEKPKDYAYRLAYAALLEKNEQSKEAIEQYKAAININEKGFLAYFNLGVMYLNMGSEWQQKAGEETDESKKAAWNQQAQANFQLALPMLQNAHDANPRDISTLEGLILLTARLNMKDEYAYYRNLKKTTEK